MPLRINTILKIKIVCIIATYTYSYKIYHALLFMQLIFTMLHITHASNILSPNDELDVLPVKGPTNYIALNYHLPLVITHCMCSACGHLCSCIFVSFVDYLLSILSITTIMSLHNDLSIPSITLVPCCLTNA